MIEKRQDDGSAGDVNYAQIGGTYSRYRQPEPAIAAQIHRALGDAETVLNVGAGAGSYEPSHCQVTAVEPSASMRAQRPPHFPKAIDAVAEDLPFENDSFDASMASVTVHQWSNLEAGLSEMRRVTRGPVVLLVCDPAVMMDYWLSDYIPEVREIEARRFPSLERLRGGLGGKVSVEPVPIPLDCKDGFNEAYYGRLEAFLDRDARLACSSWSLVPKAAIERFEAQLSADLSDGTWDLRYGNLRSQPFFDGPLRLVTGLPG